MAVLDSGQDRVAGPDGDGVQVPYLVMEQIIGTTVGGLLAQGPVPGVDEALRITLEVLSALGPGLDHAVLRALAKAPAHRYQQAEQFYGALRAIRSNLTERKAG